jgi:hypothetical protein
MCGGSSDVPFRSPQDRVSTVTVDQNRIYSLWLIPDGEMHVHLSSSISTVALKLCTPIFEPHVTVVWGNLSSDEEAIGRAQAVAAAGRGMAIRLMAVVCEQTYFRAMYMPVEATPPLMALHHVAAKCFGLEGKDPHYRPHLSLVYGDLEQAAKERVAKGLDIRGGEEFFASRLRLVRTDGAVNTWSRVAEFGLGERPGSRS